MQVEITLYGQRALVNAEDAAIFLKKEALVNQLKALKSIAKTMSAEQELKETDKIFGKLLRLNRKIQKSGKFVQFI